MTVSDRLKVLRQDFSAAGCYMNYGSFGPSTRAVLSEEQKTRLAINRDFRTYFTTTFTGAALRQRLSEMAEFLGTSVDEIAWLSGATEALNLVASGLELPPGAIVSVHNHEHPAGVYPWLYRARRDDVIVNQFEYPELADSNDALMRFFDGMMGPGTRVLSFSHVNYTNGAVMPVRDICDMARERDVITVVDGAQAVGMLDFEIDDLGCDIYVASLHKWCAGVYGSGFLYATEALQGRLRPLMVETNDGFSNETRFGHEAPPLSMDFRGDWPEAMRRYSTLFIYYWPTFMGTLLSLRHLQELGADVIDQTIRQLSGRLRSGLRDIVGVSVLTPENLAAGITAFNIDGFRPIEIMETLKEDYDIAGRIIEHGPNQFSAARLCTHIFNDEQQVDAVVNAVRELSRVKA